MSSKIRFIRENGSHHISCMTVLLYVDISLTSDFTSASLEIYLFILQVLAVSIAKASCLVNLATISQKEGNLNECFSFCDKALR